MAYAPQAVERRDRLGPDMLSLGGAHLDDRHRRAHRLQRMLHHVPALIDLDHDGVGLVLVEQRHGAPRPLPRRPPHGTVLQDIAAPVSPFRANDDAVVVRPGLRAHGRIDGDHDAFKIRRLGPSPFMDRQAVPNRADRHRLVLAEPNVAVSLPIDALIKEPLIFQHRREERIVAIAGTHDDAIGWWFHAAQQRIYRVTRRARVP